MIEDRISQLEKQLRHIRYDLGEAMGDRAPDYFRRPTSRTNEFLVGLGGALATLGIGYVAMRLAKLRLRDVIDRAQRMGDHGTDEEPTAPRKKNGRSTSGKRDMQNDHESMPGKSGSQREDGRPMVHGTEGGHMPDSGS